MTARRVPALSGGSSIRRKLLRVAVLSVGVALALSTLGATVYELLSIRSRTQKELAVLADVIGANSTAALAFRDGKAGEETLATLQRDPRVVAAVLRDAAGQPFARYASPDTAPQARAWVGLSQYVVVRPVLLDGQRVGEIELSADLGDVGQRLMRFGVLMVLVGAGSFLTAFLLSRRLQRLISDPILHLAETATAISRQKDYSVRVLRSSDDEVGLLIDRFNEMLAQIESRDRALESGREQLEERVRERTRELEHQVAERTRAEEALSRAVEALRLSEASMRAVIDNMLVGLVTTSERGVIESLNPAAEKIFQCRAADVVGRPLSVFLPAPLAPDADAFLRGARSKAMGRVTEWDARRQNGEVFPVEVALARYRTPDGAAHLAGSVRDISERREVDRVKREFVSTISHELRTPLTSIRGSLGLLAGGMLGDLEPDALNAVAIAERNVLRLIGLINDILDLERLENGRLELRSGRVAVGAVIQRSLDAVASMADQEGVHLKALPTTAFVLGDENRLVQVVVNLLSNAVKFSPRGGVVSIETIETEDYLELRVVDHGRGIPPAFRDRIFERFQQVDSSDARRQNGTGLGLAISKLIVEQHRGWIGVESEEGRGSTFWCRLPRWKGGSTEADGAAERLPGAHAA